MIKRKYRSKQTNLSFNLEGYMRDKEFTPIQANPPAAWHLSQASEHHLREAGEQFMLEYHIQFSKLAGSQEYNGDDVSSVKLRECVVCMSD